MASFSIRDILHKERKATPGKVVTDSNRFNGHDNRMAAHIQRVWNHACERRDGRRCKDCLRRKRQ